jgi:Zn ribbon nucleic-acid-binding protein
MYYEEEKKMDKDPAKCGYTNQDQPNEFSTEKNQRNNNARVGNRPEVIILENASIFGAVRSPIE